MALGVIIGAAIASKAISNVCNTYAQSKASTPNQQINYVINNYNNYQNNASGGIADVLNWANRMSSGMAPNGEFSFESIERSANADSYCEYCGGIVKGGSVYCPSCGARVTKQEQQQPLKETRFSFKPNQQTYNMPLGYQNPHPTYAAPKPSGYYIQCYSCGTSFIYNSDEIIRSPGANKEVKKAGFTGHTGEIKCPRCGKYLPHYESNWRS